MNTENSRNTDRQEGFIFLPIIIGVVVLIIFGAGSVLYHIEKQNKAENQQLHSEIETFKKGTPSPTPTMIMKIVPTSTPNVIPITKPNIKRLETQKPLPTKSEVLTREQELQNCLTAGQSQYDDLAMKIIAKEQSGEIDASTTQGAFNA